MRLTTLDLGAFLITQIIGKETALMYPYSLNITFCINI